MRPNSLSRLAALLMLFCIPMLQSHAQSSTRGTDFWLGFMGNTYNENKGWDYQQLQITSYAATSVTVSIPGMNWQKTIELAANASHIFDMPQELTYSILQEERINTGVHIRSNDSISVAAFCSSRQLSDATRLRPVNLLGTRYRVLAHEGFDKYLSQLIIVATEDRTRIRITPSVRTNKSSPPGIPLIVILNRGQAYQMFALDGEKDLTGTTITVENSSRDCEKPLAVFAGAMLSRISLVGRECKAADYLWEQMPPLSSWGKTFYIAPFANPNRSGDFVLIRILADKDNTKVSLNKEAPITLRAGEMLKKQFSGPVIVEADQPVLVAQYMPGGFCFEGEPNLKIGDPAMVIAPPVRATTRQLIFSTLTTPQITEYFLNIIMEGDKVHDLLLDGTLFPGSFTPFPQDNTMAYSRLKLPAGTYSLHAPTPFFAQLHGQGNADSYVFNLDHTDNKEALPDYPFTGYTLSLPAQVCAGQPILLKPNEAPEYLENPNWSFGNGTSTHAPTVEYAYQTPGTYTVEFRYELGCKPYLLQHELVVHPMPQLQLEQQEIILCRGESVRLRATGGTTYSWSPATSLNNPTTGTPLATPQASTLYTVVAYNESGCSDSLTVNVIVEDVQLAIMPSVTRGYTPLEVHFSNQSTGAERYRWYIPSGEVMEGTSPTHLFTQEGVYTVEVEAITANGCSYWETISVETKNYFIPNVITPNGDGKNEYFKPNLFDTWELTIFNRWGNRVFYRQNYLDQFTGEDLPAGVYYYHLSNEHSGDVIKGWVMVLR